MLDVLIRISIAVMKHHDHKQHKKERVMSAHNSKVMLHYWQKSGQRLRLDRKLDAGADGEAVEEATLSIAPLPLLSLLSYCTYDHQSRSRTTHNTPGQPSMINNQENVPQAQLTPRPIWWWHLLSWESLFWSDCSVCEVGITLASTWTQPLMSFLLQLPEGHFLVLWNPATSWFEIWISTSGNWSVWYRQQ